MTINNAPTMLSQDFATSWLNTSRDGRKSSPLADAILAMAKASPGGMKATAFARKMIKLSVA